ncbi:hypothetical protein WJX77_004046 [Trebouxia sp. C0004]
MDFMLMPLKWGFELLTDGQAIKEHVDRFSPAGKYCGLLTQGNMVEYALLDIRSNHTASFTPSCKPLSCLVC